MKQHRSYLIIAGMALSMIACTKKTDNGTGDGSRPVTASSSPYLNHVFDYTPAPGQFVNESIGTLAGAQTLIGGIGNIVTLGAYGGYIVVGFDHSIINNTGAEIAVYGNPLIGTGAEWSEPGIVQVMRDENGNGLPDDTWYELAGSEQSNPATIFNYRITYYNPKGTANVPWKDNQGHTGSVPVNAYHNHNYYPLFIASQDSVSFTGTLLRNTFIDGPIATNLPFAWGYSDSGSPDAAAQATPPRYNSFDIANAVDKNGLKVTLPYIDFVRIYTGQNAPGNSETGEVSTEVLGVRDMGMK